MDPNMSMSASAPDNPSSSTEAGPSTRRTSLEPPVASVSTSRRSSGPVTYAPPRSLRARASLPATSAQTASRATRGAGPPKDLDKIKAKLEPDGIVARREEVVKEKESQLRELVDGHDTAVREIFHLERYISLLEGWDPQLAKQDQSAVFQDYKRAKHNLLDHVPPPISSYGAGPSSSKSRNRGFMPARTTRRQAHEVSEIFAAPTSTPAETLPSIVKGKGKAKAEEPVSDTINAKGRARLSTTAVDATTPSRSRLSVAASPSTEMPPPPVPSKKSKGRRATMAIVDTEIEVEEEPVAADLEPKGKGKKRGRMSLPNLPAKKLRAVEDVEVSSPAVDSPAETPAREASPVVVPPPAPLPSLAHIPFPPPPVRVKERMYGPKRIWYTEPSQLPPAPKHNGQIWPIIESYNHLEDTGPIPDENALHIQALNEAYFRNRVNYLQHQGRLLRLLDESDTSALGGKAKSAAAGVVRQTDYQDSLMSHMVQVRNAVMNESKGKPVICKRIARMVMAYWEHEQGKEERERAAEEKERKRKAKDLIRAIRKRWALAVKIVRARMIEAQKAEQDRLGKEHLQNMLQRSTGLLDAQRDDILGQGGELEEEEDDDNDSDGTDDISAAEDSEEGEETDSGAEDEGEDGTSAVDHSDEEEDSEGDDNEESEDVDEAEGDQAGLRALLGADENELSSVADHSITMPKDEMEVDDQAQVDGADVPPAFESANPEILPISTDALVTAVEALPDVSKPRADDGASPVLPTPILILDDAVGIDATFPKAKLQDQTGLSYAEPENGLRNDENEAMGVVIDETPVDEEVTVPVTGPNGHLDVTPTVRPRSKRLRKSRSVSAMTMSEDPDADDVEFKAEDEQDEQDDQDHDLDVKMEEAEADDRDTEDEGLLADANLPIEELLRRYGYPAPQDTDIKDKEKQEEANVVNEAENNQSHSLAEEDVVEKTDKSLLDESLKDPAASLIIEGKRNRRVRSVWTPEDNPVPPPPVLKRPKIREVDHESTPELSSDDEDTDDGEEEEVRELDESGKVRPPFLLRGTLRPYQQAGLEWLASLYANKMNGILADEMGLGKTIQTISLLGHLACDKGVWGQHLIIVPTSVILNWEMEFKKFLPGLKVLTYYGNQKERKEKRKGWHTENTWQVCITSYQIVLADQHIFRRKSWVYMILDEAHNIKNFRSQRWQTLLGFKASRRLLLTGTPLQNNLMELWSLLYFLMPNGVTADATAVVGFANHKEFSEWFSNPMDKAIETGDTLDEETLETVAKLHTLLRPFILRRLKSEVETQLPGKFEHVVYCKLSKRQRFLYDEFMSRASTKEALTSGGYLGVVNTLMQLRKVCNHPDLFEVRPVRTSFAMERSVLGDFEPSELIVRKRLLQQQDEISLEAFNLIVKREDESAWACRSRHNLDASDQLPHAIEVITKGRKPAPPKIDTRTVDGWQAYRQHVEHQNSIARWRSIRDINRIRCAAAPVYGSTFLGMVSDIPNQLLPGDLPVRTQSDMIDQFIPPVAPLIKSFSERAQQVGPILDYYAVQPPNVVARDVHQYALPGLTPSSHPSFLEPEFDTLHQATVKLQIAFPDTSLLQYDCGKLQKLYEMLRDLKAGGHRVLIFTQMTRVLDILEMFLSYNGHRYLRLDGSTKIEDRQIITERFNTDARIFCFIASSRSGGVGINLTGADTVFFYDSDWNPSMDRQCMDRAHRIGQTREVHIYRFVSIHTVEENMLKKANQKRLLDRVVIQEGDFTTEFFGKMDWRDIIDTPDTGAAIAPTEEERVEDVAVEQEPEAVDTEAVQPRVGDERDFARALAEVEDEEDAAAARLAQGEGELDVAEFGEGVKRPGLDNAKGRVSFVAEGSGTPMEIDSPMGDSSIVTGKEARNDEGQEQDEQGEDEDEEEEGEEEDDVGAVDEYMLKWVDEDWEYFVNY